MDQAYVRELQLRGIRVELIRRYSELTRIRDEFIVGKDGYYTGFLLIIGSPGSGKSTLFRNTKDVYYANDAVSAVGLYRMAWRNLNKALVIDDVDDLLLGGGRVAAPIDGGTGPAGSRATPPLPGRWHAGRRIDRLGPEEPMGAA